MSETGKLLNELPIASSVANTDKVLGFNDTSGGIGIPIAILLENAQVKLTSLIDDAILSTGSVTLNDDITNYKFFIICLSPATVPKGPGISQTFCFLNAGNAIMASMFESPSVYGVAKITISSTTSINVTALNASGWSAIEIADIYGVK